MDAGRTVLSTMERGVKKTYDALLKENLKASSPMTSSLWYLLKHPLTRSLDYYRRSSVPELVRTTAIPRPSRIPRKLRDDDRRHLARLVRARANRLVFAAVARDDLSRVAGVICRVSSYNTG